jgi:MFS family permease
MQPSLGSICPVLMVPDVCFKLPYSVFGGAKLSRQLVSHFDGLLVICLSITRRPVEQPQDCLACPVKWVARFRPDVRCKEAFSSLIVSALIIVPQLIVALMASWAGRRANTWGRRPLLLVGFAALPIRALVFAWTTSPMVLIAAQILDGVSGTMLGVLTALIVSDLTRGTGRFSLALGFVGTMSGIGASLSTTLTGLVAGSFGRAAGFLSIAAVALVALLLLWLRMPETNPSSRNDARILP